MMAVQVQGPSFDPASTQRRTRHRRWHCGSARSAAFRHHSFFGRPSGPLPMRRRQRWRCSSQVAEVGDSVIR